MQQVRSAVLVAGVLRDLPEQVSLMWEFIVLVLMFWALFLLVIGLFAPKK